MHAFLIFVDISNKCLMCLFWAALQYYVRRCGLLLQTE